MAKVGFLVNPIAGMGGVVGLKGTDGRKTLHEALQRGAEPIAPDRSLRFLGEVQRRSNSVNFFVAPGAMGGNVANQLNLEHELVGRIGKTTTARDTVRISGLMKTRRMDLIVFCGGDGTARDILTGIGQNTPTLGVPAGVKVYSSVFSINPIAAAESAVAFLEKRISTRLGEVVDLDEAAYRNNRLSIKLFGHLTTPDSGSLIQASKSPSDYSENIDLDSISECVVEGMDPKWIYVLGPGSTVEKVASRLKIEKTLLGVDVVRGDGTLLRRDADEASLLDLITSGPTKIVISPIGGQGFLFGRGNQQISPKVIRKIGVENIIIIASKSKIRALHPLRLLVDSGDDEVDQELRGYARVITGYKEETVLKVE